MISVAVPLVAWCMFLVSYTVCSKMAWALSLMGVAIVSAAVSQVLLLLAIAEVVAVEVAIVATFVTAIMFLKALQDSEQ